MPRIENLARAAVKSVLLALAFSPLLLAALVLLPYSWLLAAIELDLPVRALLGLALALALYAGGIRLIEFGLVGRSPAGSDRSGRALTASTNR